MASLLKDGRGPRAASCGDGRPVQTLNRNESRGAPDQRVHARTQSELRGRAPGLVVVYRRWCDVGQPPPGPPPTMPGSPPRRAAVALAEADGVGTAPHPGGLPARRGRCTSHQIDKIFWETRPRPGHNPRSGADQRERPPVGQRLFSLSGVIPRPRDGPDGPAQVLVSEVSDLRHYTHRELRAMASCTGVPAPLKTM